MRRVTSWLAWFAGLFGLWLLLVGTLATLELVAGLCAGAIGATAAEVVRSLGLLRFRVERAWLARTPARLAQVVPDFFLVVAVLARPRGGAFRTLPFPTGGERSVDDGRRAWAAFVGSFAPNRLVVDLDRETGEALVHDLVAARAPDRLL